MPWNSRGKLRYSAPWLAPSVISFLVFCLFQLLVGGQTEPSSASPPAASPLPPSASSIPQPPVVMIDPAHGGTDSGAVLNPAILEKDVTIAFARRLRQDLNVRGISAQLVRDGDTALSTDQRAAKANSEHPVLYLCMHATSQGSGLRIFSALLPLGPDLEDRGPFANWEAAQSKSLGRSRFAQQQLLAAIQKTGFPVRSLAAPLRPLNDLTVPALAVEIAPTIADVSQLISADFQQMVSAALANAIAPLVPSLQSTALQFNPVQFTPSTAP